MYLLMLAAALLMQGADVHGRWELQNPAIGPKAGGHRMRFPDRVEFTLRSDDGGNSETSFASDETPRSFRGLTPQQLDSPVRTTAHFEVVEEAGTFVCDGEVQARNGTGTFVFHPDRRFIEQMEASGFSHLQDKQLVTLALLEMPSQFPADLRAAGVATPALDALIGMWALGVTAGYIRDIQSVPTADNLIGMRAQGITPEFAREVRQMYPNASIDDLITMRIFGVNRIR